MLKPGIRHFAAAFVLGSALAVSGAASAQLKPQGVQAADDPAAAIAALDSISQHDWNLLTGLELANRVLGQSSLGSLRAAAQADARAQALLGTITSAGLAGVARDDQEANRLLRLAADSGNAYAQGLLGFRFQTGRQGLARDTVEAQRLLRLAAEQGSAFAQLNLGVAHQNGDGVAGDFVEAVRFYRMAADQGSAAGMRYLGFMYENGLGVAADRGEAVRLYRGAVSSGYAPARQDLARLGESQ